jgi:L,D-transpeptidase YcbB
MKQILLISFCFGIGFFACNNKPATVKDVTITPKTAFNSLFFDSVQLDNFLAKNQELEKFKEQYSAFYKQRNYQFAWIDVKGFDEQAIHLANLVNNAVSDLQDSSIFIGKFNASYNQVLVEGLENLETERILETELLLTGQFFNYVAKVYKGMDVNAEELGWFIPRKKVDLGKLLDTVIKSKDYKVDSYLPFNSQYYKLREQLKIYYELQKKYSWDTFAVAPKMYKKRDSSLYIKKIKTYLIRLGDLKANDTSKKFTAETEKAIKSFKKRFGLPIDATISKRFIQELNVPIRLRIEQLLVNLERARWLPAEKDSNYIVVNIPEYKMHIFDSAVNKWDMNVIVGKAATSTVIFTGNLKHIVFSPYWRLPKSIIRNEIMPKYRKDKSYLERNGMEIYAKGDSFPLIRQKPGPKNSLGNVKFLFPNSYDIYFHDTPERSLFGANDRSYSHGCIRVGEPAKLAQYLLRKDTTYKPNIIDSLMHLPKEKWVTLPKSVPVFLVYFTTWVDKGGKLNFRKDIYKHDEKMANKLFDREPIISKDSLLVIKKKDTLKAN